MISLEISDDVDSKWNDRLLDVNNATFLQTRELILSEKIFGNEPLFLSFINNKGEIVAQIGIILYPFLSKHGIKGKLFKKIPGVKSILARWFYGPIIFNHEFEHDVKNELRNFLLERNFKVWGSEHPFSNSLLTNMELFHNESWATFLIDLQFDNQKIWKKMDKHSVRKNIQRSKSRNVIIKQMNKKDIPILYNLEKENNKIDDSISISQMEKQWSILQSVNYSGFIAYIDDEPVGAMKFSSFNKYILEFEVARSKRDFTEKLYSQDLIKWKIIEDGINNGCKYYDLSGVNPNPVTEKDKGIFRYKKKWGGTLMNYNIIKS